MTMHPGNCALCGRECNLTFEHIPPREAFNTFPAKPVTGEGYYFEKNRLPWDTSGLKYQNKQRGMGYYSLCNDCNNKTGSWYGEEYVRIAKIVHSVLMHPDIKDSIGFCIKEIFPVRFAKQVLSMFCSINRNIAGMDWLKQFVIDKHAIGLDNEKYRLHMYFTYSNIMRYASYSIVEKKINNSKKVMGLSEITAYPFGFILYFNPTNEWIYDGIDISSFCNYKYDEATSLELPLKIFEMNDVLPNLYRSKEEIKKRIEENKDFK